MITLGPKHDFQIGRKFPPNDPNIGKTDKFQEFNILGRFCSIFELLPRKIFF